MSRQSFTFSLLFLSLFTQSITASIICGDTLKQIITYALPPVFDWPDIHSYETVLKDFKSYTQVAKQWTPLVQEIFSVRYNFFEIYEHCTLNLKYKENFILNQFSKTDFNSVTQEIKVVFAMIKLGLKSIPHFTAQQKQLLVNIWYSKQIKKLITQNEYGQPWFLLVQDIINSCTNLSQKKIIIEQYRKDITNYSTNRIGNCLFNDIFPKESHH